MGKLLRSTTKIISCLTAASLISYKVISEKIFNENFKNLNCEEIEDKDIKILSIDGENIAAKFISAYSNKLLIFISDIFDDFHYDKNAIINYFIKKDFNILIIKNVRKKFTFGIKESIDLTQLIKALKAKEQQYKIYIYGQGIGGDTAIMFLANNLIDACVVENAYFNLESFINKKLQEHIVLTNYALIKKCFYETFFKYYAYKISDFEYSLFLKNNMTPILFTCKKEMNNNAKKLYEKNLGIKKYFAYQNDYEVEKYLNVINKFFDSLTD